MRCWNSVSVNSANVFKSDHRIQCLSPTSGSHYSKPNSVFLDEFNSFLSLAATTPHEFITTGDFNIHVDNCTNHFTSQFLSLLSSFNLHVHFPTHKDNHTLDLIITSSDSSLSPSLSTTCITPCDHFPIFTVRAMLLRY